MTLIERLPTCLGDEAAAKMRAVFEGFGPYRTYVSAQQREGLGKGLVRRHDALMNHVMAQAKSGRSEGLTELSARINLFRGTLAEGGEIRVPGCEPLYHHPRFIEIARRMSGRPLITPSMLYANILVPGQELPLHTDTPAFWGLDQTDTPEWLLVCMAHSGLFEDWRVPMIGAVSFFGGCEGGALVCHVDGVTERVPPADDSAVVVATEEVFHGVGRVGGPEHPAPAAPVGAAIEHVGGDLWQVRSRGEVIAEHRWGELRFSVQWKARCEFAEPKAAGPLTRDEAEARLVDDLRARGALKDGPPDPTGAAVQMIQTYVRFPDVALG